MTRKNGKSDAPESVPDLDRLSCPMPAEAATFEPMPKRIGDLMSRLPSPIPDAEIERRDREIEDRERQIEQGERAFRWRSLVMKLGRRYEACTLSNFEAKSDEQKAVVAALEGHCRKMRELSSDGAGVVLYGPKGTGKDHLLTSLMRAAVLRFGFTVEWCNGADLFGEWRDAIDRNGTERDGVSRLGGPDVLAISDPLPPVGKLSEWQASMLFRVLDYRYRRQRPTWITVNVATRQELDERMGAQLADRVVDGALTCFCNWPSHRKKRG